MKRYLIFLPLLVIGWALSGPAATLAQSKTQDPQVPIARDDTAYTFVDTAVDVRVLDNDEETNPGLIVLLEDDAIVTPPIHGTATLERNRTPDAEDDFIRYTPNAGFIGKDSLMYEIENNFRVRRGAWVFIYVNQPPVAQEDRLEVLPDVITELDVLANDTDADGDALVVDSIDPTAVNGVATIGAGLGSIIYTPNNGFIGRDSLRYFVFDGKNGLDSAWVFLTINAPPVAEPDSASTLPGIAVVIDVLDNDTDPEGGPLTVGDILDGPSGGAVAVNGVVTYTPDAGFVGIDRFSYVAVDPLGGTDTARVAVLVNTPPVAVDDSTGTLFGIALDIEVLANDTDADGDALSVEAVVDAPDNGTATVIDSGQRVRYTPNAGFFGVDTFAYATADGRGGVDEAAVTVTVSADAAVQFIHNALPASPVDVYVNDTRVLDDFGFRTATPYLAVPAGDAMVAVTEGTAADNSAPFFTTTLSLVPQAAYVAIAGGVAGQNFDILVKADARPAASDSSKAEFFIAHGVLDAPASGIDLRLLDPFNDNLPAQTLADDINFEELSDYMSLEAALYNIDATSFNGSTVYDAYHFDLETFGGKTFTLLLSGLFNPGTGEPGFAVVGFDADGNALMLDVATATEDTAELPKAFALRGNYPNPFNPTTTIQFDLPEPARVSVEIVDVLGRVVLVMPAQAVEAGVNRALDVDAGSLASGTYFYRLVAQTPTDALVRTGQMLLVK